MTTTEYGIVSGFARGVDWLDDGNGNFTQLRRSASAQWANKVSTTTGLTYGYFGGMAWTGSAWDDIVDGTTTLADNTTNYVERTVAGVVSDNAVGFTATSLPMAVVTTVSGEITAILDYRRDHIPGSAGTPTGAAGGSLGGTYPNPSIASSVSLPGSPTTTTQSPADNSTKVATTAYVDDAVSGVSGALADGDYGDITVSSSGTVMNIDAGVVTGTEIATDVALAGNPTTTTQGAGNNTTRIATTAFVTAAVSSGSVADGDKGDIVVSSSGAVWTIDSAVVSGSKIASSVALAGSPTTTTQTAGDNSTKLSTTAYVKTAIDNATGGAGALPTFITAHPDFPPSSPNVDDHEYENGDTIGGTTLGSPGVSPAISDNRLVITGNAAGVTASVVAVVYTAPSKPYTITAKVRNATVAGTFGVTGIMLRSSVSGRFRTANMTRTAADFHGFTASSGAYTALTTRGSDDSSVVLGQSWLYVRLTYSSTTISVYVSEDGMPGNWVLLRSDTDSTHFTGGNLPDQFGVFVDSFAASSRVGFIDWLRVT